MYRLYICVCSICWAVSSSLLHAKKVTMRTYCCVSVAAHVASPLVHVFSAHAHVT